jgi:hypothetical protein
LESEEKGEEEKRRKGEEDVGKLSNCKYPTTTHRIPADAISHAWTHTGTRRRHTRTPK